MSNQTSFIKMDKANRAKQFMPFDALTGFREALREKERLVEESVNGVDTMERKHGSQECDISLDDISCIRIIEE